MIASSDRKSLYKNICDNLKSLRPSSLIYDNLESNYTFTLNSITTIDENDYINNTDSETITRKVSSNNNSSPDSNQSILSSSSDSASEVFELINSYDIKVIQKNIYNNNMKFINTELLCNLCVNNIVLDNINPCFTLLYNYQYKDYNKQLKTKSMSSIDTILDSKILNKNIFAKSMNFYNSSYSSKKYLKLLIEIADMNIINLFNTNLYHKDEINILRQIYIAIQSYTKSKIIHNDLFPRNILIKSSKTNTPIISDFGYSLIDNDSYILTDNKYKKDISNILYNMNVNEDDDIKYYINLISDKLCNFIVHKTSYVNVSIYKKDIITITESILLLSNKKETKHKCEYILVKILNDKIDSFDDLYFFISKILNDI